MSKSETADCLITSHTASLPEVYRSVPVRSGASRWRKLIAFSGPGLLVAVGYMDPGNWATDIAGGSRYGYQLLSVILLSNLTAILLQSLAARLGIVTNRDLAQACREYYPRPVAIVLWVLCEIAIAACDLAEIIGSAIALQLLFGVPLLWGVCLTAFDVLLILMLQRYGFRLVEALVAVLILTIGLCFALEIAWARPDWGGIVRGLVPTLQPLRDPDMLYLAVGILGATVMPHNLYLHSSIVQTRAVERTNRGIREAIRYNNIDVVASLSLAFLINAAILVMAAAVFHRAGRVDVAEIQDAYQTLTPLLGTTVASSLFAVALLCSGQNATITGTMAGQIVMEGFVRIRLKPWLRRLLTRSIAIIPAIVITALYGEGGDARLLILSQVILSLHLPFAIFPLIMFTGDRRKMGEFVSSRLLRALAWAAALVITGFNGWLLWQTFG
ncbi:MAG TPA: Nramp family divalent metal transporter [Pyrinomonadaceae bacterium]|nr:Nramp family divalent metal transporter [Pyrinomonadaceae bacterium]